MALEQCSHMAPPDPGPGIVTGHPIYISNTGDKRTIYQSEALPEVMKRPLWKLSQFDVHRQLYRSSTSLVVHATDHSTRTEVALKLYLKSKLVTLTRYQVEREIRIHSTMRHPNLISLLAAFENARHVVLVLEWAPGGDLYTALDRAGGQLSEGLTVSAVLSPFLQGMAYMHGKHIIHRDIKPENILLSATSGVKLADFGLAIDCSQERPVTRGGTLDYMAPEVLMCHNKAKPEDYKDRTTLMYNPQVDVWAVGVLAYELLMGRPPFEHESRIQTVERILYQRLSFPVPISDLAKDFITRSLCKSAKKRPSLQELLTHPWIVAHSQTGAPAAPMRSLSPPVMDYCSERCSCPEPDLGQGREEEEDEILAVVNSPRRSGSMLTSGGGGGGGACAASAPHAMASKPPTLATSISCCGPERTVTSGRPHSPPQQARQAVGGNAGPPPALGFWPGAGARARARAAAGGYLEGLGGGAGAKAPASSAVARQPRAADGGAATGEAAVAMAMALQQGQLATVVSTGSAGALPCMHASLTAPQPAALTLTPSPSVPALGGGPVAAAAAAAAAAVAAAAAAPGASGLWTPRSYRLATAMAAGQAQASSSPMAAGGVRTNIVVTSRKPYKAYGSSALHSGAQAAMRSAVSSVASAGARPSSAPQGVPRALPLPLLSAFSAFAQPTPMPMPTLTSGKVAAYGLPGEDTPPAELLRANDSTQDGGSSSASTLPPRLACASAASMQQLGSPIAPWAASDTLSFNADTCLHSGMMRLLGGMQEARGSAMQARTLSEVAAVSRGAAEPEAAWVPLHGERQSPSQQKQAAGQDEEASVAPKGQLAERLGIVALAGSVTTDGTPAAAAVATAAATAPEGPGAMGGSAQAACHRQQAPQPAPAPAPAGQTLGFFPFSHLLSCFHGRASAR